ALFKETSPLTSDPVSTLFRSAFGKCSTTTSKTCASHTPGSSLYDELPHKRFLEAVGAANTVTIFSVYCIIFLHSTQEKKRTSPMTPWFNVLIYTSKYVDTYWP
ncbi:unnamed protein product, partial [Ectocarpus sp. 12 AP-2014]